MTSHQLPASSEAVAQGEQAYKQVQIADLTFKLPSWLATDRNTISAGGLLAFEVMVPDQGIIDPRVRDGLDGKNSVLISLVENDTFIGITNNELLQRSLRVSTFKEKKGPYSIYTGPGWDNYVRDDDRSVFFACFW